MLSKELNDGPIFEREVRAIARQLWPSAGYHGAQMFEGRERDGVFELEDSIHCIECTISRDEKKTRGDLEKLAELVDLLKRQNPKKAVRGWFVTLHEPTADQAKYIILRKSVVNHETFDKFRSKLIDASDFISLRSKYPFGSARNIEDGSFDIPNDEFVEVSLFPEDRSKPLGVRQLSKILRDQNRRCVLFGEYGVGKSMALRQIYFELCERYMNGSDIRFPVYINLRDHREIGDISDALRQHSRSIGYKDENHLIRAFRAGYTILILDGFDEAPPRVGARTASKARELRRSALTLVRRFMSDAPSRTPIVLAGRNNFFDGAEEIRHALGIGDNTLQLSMSDFSESQIEAYLRKKGVLNVLPVWLPRKPLLIGYFVTRNLTSLLQSGVSEQEVGLGWESLIRSICEREASQIEIGIYPSELYELYGRIATKARKKLDKLGPITFEEMKEAFREIFGFDPEDRALTALLRLPGLSSASASYAKADDESRWFIDGSFMDAVAAADILPIARNMYQDQTEIYRGVRHQLSEVGVSVASALCVKEGIEETKLLGALYRIEQKSPESVLAIDFLQISRMCGSKTIPRLIVLDGQFVEELFMNIDEGNISNVSIQNSYFKRAFFDAQDVGALPAFEECYFGEIRTPLRLEDLTSRLMNCQYDSVKIIEAPRPGATYGEVRIGVLRSILDKIFIQSLGGREERALSRGIPTEALQYVQPITEVLRRNNFCFRRNIRGTPILYPVRSRLADVRHLMDEAEASSDAVIQQVLNV